MAKNDELLKRLLATFRVEAEEHINTMASGLLALEKAAAGPEAAAIIETVFRGAHSLKGAARAVNLTSIESLCQSLESVFAELKGSRLPISRPLLDLLYQAIDGLGDLLVDPEITRAVTPAAEALIRQLDLVASGVAPVTAQTTASPSASPPTPTTPTSGGVAPAPPPLPGMGATGTVRISTEKLDSVMRQVEELLSPRLAARQRALELHDAMVTLSGWKKSRVQMQPVLRHIERSATRENAASGSPQGEKELLAVLDYLDGEQHLLATLGDRLARLTESAARDQRELAGMTESLLYDVKAMQLLPFASLFDILPRLARDLAREQGKEVELALHGGGIELDRRILEEMKDPFIHLLRNAIDHGIESPAVRATAGKPPRGTMTFSVSQLDSGKVEVQVTDDGAGIDGKQVVAAARKLGVLPGETGEAMDERDKLSLIFHSGVSTSPIITDVSGRGLGLAIVHEKVESLGGAISIDSSPGSGTTFHIVLPLSLATFRGVLVRVGEHLCAIPAVGVERAARVAVQDIRSVENRETVVLEDRVLSLVGLSDVLELPRSPGNGAATHTLVIVLGHNGGRVAFRVDEILGEQEILVKPLGPQLARVRNVAGASMLGTGRLVPVLNVSDLLKSAVKAAVPPLSAPGPEPAGPGARRSILVVEDSITSRTLLKNILESSGFSVTTAVDGMDAYTTLKTGEFDLLVSDVEMPRMDGFDLTAKVRADKQLAELPVVLVTALESREHRARGIDVGANAYIVKSSFDQSNLLETIRRLI